MLRHEPPAPSRAELAGLAALVLLGLAVRVLWLRDAAQLPFFTLPQTDDYVYAHGATRIAAGDLWLAGEPLRFGPPYFYVLALVDLVAGDGPLPPRLLQMALGLGVVPLVWATARTLTTSPRAALVAAALSALYAPAIFFESLLLPETCMSLVHAALALALVRASADAGWRRWTGVGLLVGASIAFRPNAALLILPLLVAALRRVESERPGARELRGASLLGFAVLGLAPLMLRNLAALGTPFSASTAGINAFIGNGPGASGVYRVPPEVPGATSAEGQFDSFRIAASQALGHEASDVETDRFWLSRTIDHAAAHPLDVLEVLARKARLFWNARELSNLVDYDFVRSLGNTLGLPLPQFAWIAPLGLAGMLLMMSSRRTAPERALAGLLAAGSVSVILVFVQDRYRVPLVPWVIVTAVVGGKTLVDRARAAQWRPLGLALLPVAIGLALTFPPVGVRAHPERQWSALGAGYRELGRDRQACVAFERALEADPTFPAAREGAAATCP